LQALRPAHVYGRAQQLDGGDNSKKQQTRSKPDNQAHDHGQPQAVRREQRHKTRRRAQHARKHQRAQRAQPVHDQPGGNLNKRMRPEGCAQKNAKPCIVEIEQKPELLCHGRDVQKHKAHAQAAQGRKPKINRNHAESLLKAIKNGCVHA